MDKIEIDIELLQEIQKEIRNLRVSNMELHSQLDAVKRLLGSIEVHLPRETTIEYMPEVLAKINKTIEKSQKKESEEKPKKKAITSKS